MLPFCGHFYCVSHQQSNSNKFKDFKTFEYYGIRIETSEPTTVVEYRRMNKLDSETKIRIIWWGPKNLFDLDDFSNYVSLNQRSFLEGILFLNSEGTKDAFRFRGSFELQEFELHEFNCSYFLFTFITHSFRYSSNIPTRIPRTASVCFLCSNR